jgi:hypothetical protein
LAWSQNKSRLGFNVSARLSGALSAEFKNNENRRAPRRRYNDDAWIRVQGSLLRRCRVLDLSRTGVRLTITNAEKIPDTFSLILSKYSPGCPAVVKWRRQTEIGAEYSLAAERRPGSYWK